MENKEKAALFTGEHRGVWKVWDEQTDPSDPATFEGGYVLVATDSADAITQAKSAGVVTGLSPITAEPIGSAVMII